MKIRNLIVTKYGEKIQFQLDPNFGEDTKVRFGLHVHKVCGGFINKRSVSSSHYVLKCRACGLRVVIPNEIDTYKKLKNYLKVLRKREEK